MATNKTLAHLDLLSSVHGVEHAFELRGGRLDQALPRPVARLRQVHGARVHRLDTDGPWPEGLFAARVDERPEGDALVTDRPGLTVAVATADCVPVLVAARDGRAVAAVHAGWRGLAAGVVGAALRELQAAFGVDPAGCVIGIGPAVGRCCYVVGDDVAEAFAAAGLTEAAFDDVATASPPYPCDLLAATRRQAERVGVPGDAIATLGLCTACNPDRLWSYRHHGDAAGRMLAGIAIGNPTADLTVARRH